MTIPPNQRPSAAELAAQSNASVPLQIAGKPAVACPYCGAGMFVNGTQALQTRVDRYEVCRCCHRRFLTRQPQKVFVREVKPGGGSEGLALYRDTA